MSWYDRLAVAIASSRPGAWLFVNVAMRLDRVLIPLTHGRLELPRHELSASASAPVRSPPTRETSTPSGMSWSSGSPGSTMRRWFTAEPTMPDISAGSGASPAIAP